MYLPLLYKWRLDSALNKIQHTIASGIKVGFPLAFDMLRCIFIVQIGPLQPFDMTQIRERETVTDALMGLSFRPTHN
jgi:hypothetical protein